MLGNPSGLFEFDILGRAYGISRLRQDRWGWGQRPVAIPIVVARRLELTSALDHKVHQSAGNDDFSHDGDGRQQAPDLGVTLHHGEQLVALEL